MRSMFKLGVMLFALVPAGAFADDQGQRQGPGPGGHRGPPPEAISACQGKAVSATCSFTGRKGESVEGVCRGAPDGDTSKPVACAPNHPPGGQGGPGGHHGPPPEALQACQGKSQGATCSVETPDGQTLGGKCDRPPNDSSKPLACRPDNMPPPPQE